MELKTLNTSFSSEMLNTKTQTTGFSQEDSDEQSGVFNDDILTEILLRLPVTSILRFKSVCKHWLWLLSDRRFTFRYDKLSKPLKFCFNSCGIIILQSCNGLLLSCISGNDFGKRKYYVFNPTTKQCALIPSIRGGYMARRSIRFMGLAFHQTDCVHYKVVCIRVLDKSFQIQMYSSDTGKWKISVESFTLLSPRELFRNGVYWNGAIYLVPTSQHQFYFQIDVEQWKSLPVKMRPSAFTEMKYFGESRGHLHLIANHDKLRLDVYEMSCHHSGWSFKYQLDLCELPHAFPEIIGYNNYYDFSVVDMVRGEEEEDTFVVLQIPGKLIRYNVHDRSFKCFMNIIRHNFSIGYSKLHRYTATLASF